MRSQLKWTLAALALGILAMVGFAVAAAARGDGGEAEPRAIRMQIDLAPGRDLEELPERPALPLPEPLRAHLFVGVTLAQTDEGVEITGVVPGSPAAEADLREGDLIRAIDGEKVDSVEAVIGRVRDAEAGDELIFTVEREGRELDIEVRLAPERARLELPPGHGGIPPGRLRERLPEFDLEDLLPEDFPQRAWRFVERRDLLDEALGRFISAQVRYLDEDGKPASVQALGGTVSGVDVSEGTLTVTGNEPQVTLQTFAITEDTRIRRDFRRAELADLEVNDRVVVIAVGEGDEAAVVLAFSPPEES
ncbi:MAG: PDZ domain-containing protein [Dehalococcoidia bacterium]